MTPDRFIEAIEAFSRYKVLVIGDMMVDEYLWGSVHRISPEAPVQIIDVESQELRLGGCGNVVNNLSVFGCTIAIVSAIGADNLQNFVEKKFTSLGVTTDGLFIDQERPTTKKTRAIAAGQQIIRIDTEKRDFLSVSIEKKITSYLQKNLQYFDIIILSDYAKGVITKSILSVAIKESNVQRIPIIIDPKGRDFSKYTYGTVLTPNEREAEQAIHREIHDSVTAEEAAKEILGVGSFKAVLITRGKEGMTLYEEGASSAVHIDSQAKEVFDVSGAGDTVLSILGLGIAAGLQLEEASFLANIAGGIVVGKLGTSTVSKGELLFAIKHKKDHLLFGR